MGYSVFEPVATAAGGGIARSPVASTSRIPIENGRSASAAASTAQASPKAVFKKRKKDTERSQSVGNGHSTGESSPNGQKRVKTFHDSEDDSGSEVDTAAEVSSIGQHLNGSETAESRKQLRKRQQQEKAARLLNTRQSLPVWHAQEAILKEIDARDTVVVLGETGSGKTTRRLALPPLAEDTGLKPRLFVQKYPNFSSTARYVVLDLG